MFQAISVILPVIAVIFVGYFSGRRGVLSSAQVATLNRFVFVLAAPALLFRNVALTEFPEIIPWGLWLSYYGAMLLAMGLSILAAFVFLPATRPAEKVIIGFGSSFSNTVMLGIPILLTAFGMQAGLPLFLVLAFHGLLVFTVALIGLEVTTNPALNWRQFLPKLGRAMRDQHVLMGLAAGVIWNFTGLGLAVPVNRFLELLGSAAIPVALIAVGGRLAFIPWRASLGPSLYIGVFKLAIHPFLVFCCASFLFNLPPLFVATITVLAAMPTGVFTAVFAEQYETAEATASSAIVVTTVLGAVSIALWLSLFTELLVD